jgi:hypothetical protein
MAALYAMNSVMQNQANKGQKYPNGYVAGGLMRGGGTETPPVMKHTLTPPDEPSVAQEYANAPPAAPAIPAQERESGLLGQLAVAPPAPTVNDGVQRIRDRLARRDEPQAPAPEVRYEPRYEPPQLVSKPAAGRQQRMFEEEATKIVMPA